MNRYKCDRVGGLTNRTNRTGLGGLESVIKSSGCSGRKNRLDVHSNQVGFGMNDKKLVKLVMLKSPEVHSNQVGLVMDEKTEV